MPTKKISEHVSIEKFVGTLWVNLAFFFVSCILIYGMQG